MLLFAPELTPVSEFALRNFGGTESRVCHETYFKTMLNKEEK